LDRSGLVLGRTRSLEQCIELLISHLGVFSPPPPDTMRMKMRALVGDGGRLVLAGFPLFSDPPVIERRMERMSHRIVDRLAVDITREGVLMLSPASWQSAATRYEVAGHTGAPSEPLNVAAVLIPSISATEPSQAAVIAFLATNVSSHATNAERVHLAETLAARGVVSVQLNDRAERYEALRQ
jgi:hypothetical protein